MERPRAPRQRPAQSSEARRRETRPAWATSTLIAGAAALGIFTMAGLLAYRYLLTGKPAKKARSKHGKKERKSKKHEVAEEEPDLRKSGAGSPRGPSRPASPVAPVKSVPDASRQDQFAWWKEIAVDQFEARKTEHAQYYAKKALDLAVSIPYIQDTASYQQLRFVLATSIADPEARMKELQSIREALGRIGSSEGKMKEYHLLKGRVLATLSDAMVRRQMWAEAETICEETIVSMQLGFEGQEAMLFTNLAIQHYQLAGVQRGLKKYEAAAESSKIAYENVVKSKLAPDFWSQVARQRADLLDALDRFDEAKQVMVDHLKRIEAHHESLTANLAEKLAKQKVRAEKIASGQMPEEEDGLLEEDDEDDDDDDIDEDSAAQSQQAVNQKHISTVADNHMFLGRLNFERGFYAEAAEALEQAYAMSPNYHYLSMLACAQFELGLAAEAVATQNKIKESRPHGEMPIATSRALITKTHYLRQAKRDGPWVFSIEVENKKTSPLAETTRLTAGTFIEAFVRRHYSPDEAVPAGNKKNRSQGPYTYTVTGEEKDCFMKIKGLLSDALENGKIYEIVLFAYSSAEKTERIATHRQLARAADINNVFRSSMLSGAPFSKEQLEEELDDYTLPVKGENAVEEEDEEEIVAEEINADAQAGSSAPASVEEIADFTANPEAEKVEEVAAVEKVVAAEKVDEQMAKIEESIAAVQEFIAAPVEEKAEEVVAVVEVVEVTEVAVVNEDEKVEVVAVVEEPIAVATVVAVEAEEKPEEVVAVTVEEPVAVEESAEIVAADEEEKKDIVAAAEEIVAVVEEVVAAVEEKVEEIVSEQTEAVEEEKAAEEAPETAEQADVAEQN